MQTVLAVAAGMALAMLIGTLDRQSAEVTAQHIKAADERKADMPPADRIYPFRLPLEYDFTATHSGPEGLGRTRFYSRGTK